MAERPKARPPRTQTPLAKHRYRPDGLVETNLDGPHPIYELISRAEQDWEAKHERASKTLDEAVAEYKRAVLAEAAQGIRPLVCALCLARSRVAEYPRWSYVTEHNVQLPDEYDQIHNDLEPFWGP